MSSKTTESIWNVWCEWGSFLGEAEETLLRSVYMSVCPIPSAAVWNFEQIISRMSLKIKFVLKFCMLEASPVNEVKGNLVEIQISLCSTFVCKFPF